VIEVKSKEECLNLNRMKRTSIKNATKETRVCLVAKHLSRLVSNAAPAHIKEGDRGQKQRGMPEAYEKNKH